ncbi:MAG: hypothetical protein KatS3mg127_1314 [Silanimonas sp.]|nr:MAG: hypothetical protein KatS3mg127_1314 [Silanimonas sp.]
MSDALWYYVSADRQRHGPVGPDVLRALAADGSLTATSLVWREGLPQWQPLSTLAAELGLSLEVAPPPLPAGNGNGDGGAAGHAVGHSPSTAPEPAGADAVVDAGFLRRLAAHLIDTVLLAGAGYALLFLLLLGFGIGLAGMAALFDPAAPPPDDGLLALLLVGLYVLPILMQGAYHILFTSSAWQATPGKRAVGIKVVDFEGKRISTARSAGRWFAAALSYLTLYFGFLMAAFTDRKMALHDMVASTRVVDQWAYTAHPERQQRGLGGCAIATLAAGGLLFALVFLATLAAIALPAYQDYTQRSRISELMVQATPYQAAMNDFLGNTDRCPDDFGEIGLAPFTHALVAEAELGENGLGECVLQLVLEQDQTLGPLAGEYVWFSVGGHDGFRCRSSAADEVLPLACRG